MPYVQRDKSGKICGHSISEQPDAKEFLPDDNPEVVAYMASFPPGFLTQPTPQEWKRMEEERERINKEHETIRKLNVAFSLRFSELELALGNLLSEILHIPKSRLAHAIYYSPTSFHARCEIVGNAVVQIADENTADLGKLIDHWEVIEKHIGKVRNLRNAVAHSSQITNTIRGKKYARLSPPAFDVIRIDRAIARREIPGLSSDDLLRGCYRVAWCVDRVDEVNRLVATFHSDKTALPEKYLELEAGLKKSRNPSPDDPKP